MAEDADNTKQNNQKIKQPPILFDQTQEILADLTALLGGTFITYWNNPRGSVVHNDVVVLYEILEKLGHQDTLNIFIKSSGGTGQASLRIVNLLRQYCDRLVALVPLECASAATMVALGADEILMGPMAYLTAVDTSLTHDLSPLDRDNSRVSVSLDELNRVLRLWRADQADSQEHPYKELFQYIHPLVIGAVDRAESLSIMLCKELLGYHIKDSELAEQIANSLNAKYPSHNYPILFEEAQKIGLQVVLMDPKINNLLLTLNEMYSEMGQRSTTDFDEIRSHDNEILNIWETLDLQIYFQQDKDWFYRSEERRWITMNNNSTWRRLLRVDGETKQSVLHIA